MQPVLLRPIVRQAYRLRSQDGKAADQVQMATDLTGPGRLINRRCLSSPRAWLRLYIQDAIRLIGFLSPFGPHQQAKAFGNAEFFCRSLVTIR